MLSPKRNRSRTEPSARSVRNPCYRKRNGTGGDFQDRAEQDRNARHVEENGPALRGRRWARVCSGGRPRMRASNDGLRTLF